MLWQFSCMAIHFSLFKNNVPEQPATINSNAHVTAFPSCVSKFFSPQKVLLLKCSAESLCTAMYKSEIYKWSKMVFPFRLSRCKAEVEVFWFQEVEGLCNGQADFLFLVVQYASVWETEGSQEDWHWWEPATRGASTDGSRWVKAGNERLKWGTLQEKIFLISIEKCL